MSTGLAVTIYGLGAGVGWGLSNFIAAKASRKVGGMTTGFLLNTIGVIAYAIVYLIWLRPATIHLTSSGVAYAIASGVFITVGAMAFFSGLRIGPVSYVSPLSGTYPLVTTLMATILFGALLTGQQVIGILLIVLGALATAEVLQLGTVRRSIAKGPRLGLLTALLWGIGYSLLAQSITRLGWQTATFIEFWSIVAAFLVCLRFIMHREKHTARDMWLAATNKHILVSGIISAGAGLLLNIGMSREASSGALIAALSACYPAITIMLALRHFKEDVRIVPLLGAAISMMGVICITLS